MNDKELEIIRQWEEEGHVSGMSFHFTVSKAFWDIMSEIIYLGYVDLHE